MRRLYISLFILVFFTQSCVPTYIDTVSVKSLTTGPIVSKTEHIKNLLIISYGNLSSRVVSDNIHLAIERQMVAKGSKVDFLFKSAFGVIESSGINSPEAKGHQGYMFFYPKDTSSVDLHHSRFVVGTPVINGQYGTATGYGNVYEDTFWVKLFNSKKELVYTGEIDFHFDPAKDRYYDKVANKLIEQLSQVHIMLW